MKKHTAQAKDYFERHHREECFITADGRVFHDSGAARSFATTLEDNQIEHYTRSEVETTTIDNVAEPIDENLKSEPIDEPTDVHSEPIQEPIVEPTENVSTITENPADAPATAKEKTSKSKSKA